MALHSSANCYNTIFCYFRALSCSSKAYWSKNNSFNNKIHYNICNNYRFLNDDDEEDSFPRSIFIIYWFIAIIVTLGIRYIAYWSIYLFPYSSKNKIKVAIFGAGQAGAMLAESIQTSDIYKLEAIFDDDRKKIGTIINSVKVYDSTKIEKIILEKNLKLFYLQFHR